MYFTHMTMDRIVYSCISAWITQDYTTSDYTVVMTTKFLLHHYIVLQKHIELLHQLLESTLLNLLNGLHAGSTLNTVS